MSKEYKAVQVDARAGRAELAPQLNGTRSKEFIKTTSERLTVGSGRASAALSLGIGAEQRSGLTLLKRQNSVHPHRIPLLRANGEVVPFSRVIQSSAKTSWKHVVMEQHQISSNEWANLMHKQHVIVVNVGRGVNCEFKDGGRSQRSLKLTGAVSFFQVSNLSF